MRKYVFMLCACVILCFIIGMYPVSTQASETAADELSDLIYQYVYGSEAGSEGLTYELADHFFADPATFIRRLALESEDIQKTVVNKLPRSMYYAMHPRGFHEFTNVVYSIQLTDEDSEETRNVVKDLEDEITKYWGISNPQTGDPVGLAVLLMAVSGLGVAFLRKKRKTVA